MLESHLQAMWCFGVFAQIFTITGLWYIIRTKDYCMILMVICCVVTRYTSNYSRDFDYLLLMSSIITFARVYAKIRSLLIFFLLFIYFDLFFLYLYGFEYFLSFFAQFQVLALQYVFCLILIQFNTLSIFVQFKVLILQVILSALYFVHIYAIFMLYFTRHSFLVFDF